MHLLALLGFAAAATGQICLKVPAPKMLRCGVVGDFTREVNYTPGGPFLGAALNEDLQQCAQSCLQMPGCQFMRLLTATDQCEFWRFSGQRLGFRAEKNGQWTGYNINCFVDDGFAGLQWAYFDGSQTGGVGVNIGDFYDDSTLYRASPLRYSGITDFSQQGYDLSGQDLESVRFEDQYTGSGTDFILDYHGYLVMPTTGTLKFSLTQFTGRFFFSYVGKSAYRGYNTDNAFQEQETAVATPFAVSDTRVTPDSYEAGSYVPIRFLWTQSHDTDNGAFAFQITHEDGTTFFPVDPQAGLVVRQSCDGTTAPAFPPYPAAQQT